jgi:regulation of enolase protein 1 (concanavalin A-like superfamily)
MHLTYVEATGDCSIVARVVSITGSNSWDTRVGVIARETLGTSGRYMGMTLSKGAGTFSSYRSGPTDGWSYGQWEAYTETAPYWVKLTRVGNQFTTYKSPNGVTWTEVQTTTLWSGSTTYLGLMVCAGSNTNPATATFDNITTSVPVVVPAGPQLTDIDIGPVGSVGSGTMASNGTVTIVGSGSNYGGSQDQMHFTYLEASGDCSIVARVASISGSSAWDTRVGVIARETLGTMGKYMAMTLSKGAGTFSSYRTGATDPWSTGQWGSGETAPYWVKFTRVGNQFTTYQSSDGVTWTEVQTTTLWSGSPCYIGLMVCAGNNSSPATATFDNLEILP